MSKLNKRQADEGISFEKKNGILWYFVIYENVNGFEVKCITAVYSVGKFFDG